MANFDLRGMVGRILKGITKHCYTQNIKALGLMVSEKNIYLWFSYCTSFGANDPGCSQFGPQGHDWQDLCSVPLNIATY